MRIECLLLATMLVLLSVRPAPATVLYVDVNGTNPVPPFVDWSTAATVIQDAVDAASSGDTVLVTDGIYQTGGRPVAGALGALTNRVLVTKPLTLQSLHGAAQTIIEGYQMPGVTNGNAAVRCVQLNNGTLLSGFTLRHGATGTNTANGENVMGGAVFSNSGNTQGLVSNCVLVANSAFSLGGGAAFGTLVRCLVLSNSSASAGGTMFSALNNCLVSYNHAQGAAGTSSGPLNNCTVCYNSADSSVGGTSGGALTNCIVYHNRAPLNPDTYPVNLVAYNSCLPQLPASGTGNLTNEPFFLDPTAGDFHLQAASPCVNLGLNTLAAGNLDLEGNPRRVGLAVDVGAYECQAPFLVRYADASNTNPAPPYATWATAAPTIQEAVDWAVPGGSVLVTNGIYQTGARLGGTSLVSFTNRLVVAKPLTVQSLNGPEVTIIQGSQVPGNGTGAGVIRCAYLTNSAVLSGFTLTNGDVGAKNGGGVWCESEKEVLTNCVITRCAAYIAGGVSGGTLNGCVLAGNVAAYFGGATTATALNDCTLLTNSAKAWGGACYSGVLNTCTLLTNSALSQTGGATYSCTLTNCVLAGNSAPSGGGACLGTLVNCELEGNFASDSGGGASGASLFNCTLIGNTAQQQGGGTSGGIVTYCTFSGNSARSGGGVYSGMLNHCMLSGNTATPSGAGGGANSAALTDCLLVGNVAAYGGAAAGATLNNCTVVANSAQQYGGGVDGGTLNNCIVYYNLAASYPNCWGGTISFSCTDPLPPGPGNFTNEPLFVDLLSTNLHLQATSPCINSGKNSYASSTTDLEGTPRIIAGTIDVGAYEFPTPTSLLSYAWLQRYGLATDGSSDLADTDGDGLNNWQEWRAATDPTNSLSALKLTSLARDTSGMTVSWQSVAALTYYLQRCTNLAASPAFLSVQSNLVGQAGMTSFKDLTATNSGPYFYRVGVQ